MFQRGIIFLTRIRARKNVEFPTNRNHFYSLERYTKAKMVIYFRSFKLLTERRTIIIFRKLYLNVLNVSRLRI